jgi:hypothetical protein
MSKAQVNFDARQHPDYHEGPHDDEGGDEIDQEE